MFFANVSAFLYFFYIIFIFFIFFYIFYILLQRCSLFARRATRHVPQTGPLGVAVRNHQILTQRPLTTDAFILFSECYKRFIFFLYFDAEVLTFCSSGGSKHFQGRFLIDVKLELKRKLTLQNQSPSKAGF